jgi:betaine-aldehyde dehydrogenase
MLDQIRFFAGAARVLEGKAAGEYMKGHTSWIRREPIGVVGQVTPWNYPMMMAVWKIAPALAAGNTVVLKPSDTTPETTLLLAEIASEFLPAGTFNVVTGDRDTGRLVVEHPTPRWSPSPARCARVPRSRPARPRPQARSPRTRRQGTGHRLRRCRPRGGRRGHRDRRLLQRRPGLHGRHPRARRRRESTTTSSRRSRHTRRTTPRSAFPTTRTRPLRPGEQCQPARPGDRLPRAPPRPRVRGRRWPPPEWAGRRLLHRAHRPVGAAPGRRGDPERDLRAGHHRAEVHRRGRSAAVGQRGRLRPGVLGVDQGLRQGDADASAALDFGCVWINTHIPIVAEMPHGGFKRSGYGKDLSMYGLEDYTRIKHVMANIES